ncbi:MAG: hypothetical protein IKZ87_08920 [Actinomycetaceae bacterium]|nr:hypothetical protein [Actinomycetaceae bacterium]
MGISRVAIEDISSWVQVAAHDMGEARKVSGALSEAGAADFERSLLSTFRVGVPENMCIWRDYVGSWLWVECDDSRIAVRGGLLKNDSDVEEWMTFICEEFAGQKVLWCLWGDFDSLMPLVEKLDVEVSSVVFGAPLSSVVTSSVSSGAWLRPMASRELMPFEVAAANELGAALAASGGMERRRRSAS